GAATGPSGGSETDSADAAQGDQAVTQNGQASPDDDPVSVPGSDDDAPLGPASSPVKELTQPAAGTNQPTGHLTLHDFRAFTPAPPSTEPPLLWVHGRSGGRGGGFLRNGRAPCLGRHRTRRHLLALPERRLAVLPRCPFIHRRPRAGERPAPASAGLAGLAGHA